MSERQSISLRYHQEGTMYFSGIDQHKGDCVITTYDAAGQRVKQQRVPNEPSRLRAYFASLPGPHRAVVESTGFWYWLADLLDDLGVDLVLAHAPRLKAIAAAKVKTDHLDAALLAQLLRADFIPAAHRISLERIREKFHVTRRDQLDPWYQQQATLHEAQATLLTQQIHDLETALHPVLLPTADVQRLLWIPGIGKVNAFTSWTEIDGIAQFPSEKQFVSYCRLVPGAANSGGKTRARPGAQQGNRYLKIAFSHARVRAIQDYPVSKAFYQRQRLRKPIVVAGLPIRCLPNRRTSTAPFAGCRSNGRRRDSGPGRPARPPNWVAAFAPRAMRMIG